MVLPLIMGGIGLASQMGQMFRSAPDLEAERKRALDALHNEQKAVAGQQFSAAQQGMLQTAAMGGTAGSRASARMAALGAAPALYNQAMTNAANIGQQNLTTSAGLAGNMAGYQQGANASQDAGLASFGQRLLGASAGGAAGNMLSDVRAKELEQENAALREQLAQHRGAQAEDQAFVQRQVDLGRVSQEQAQADAPQFQIREPQMSSDLAAYWLMNQPGAPKRGTPWEEPPLETGTLSDDRAKVLESKLAREKAKNKDLSGQLSQVRERAGMSSDEAAAWIMSKSKPKAPAAKAATSPRLAPEQMSPDFEPLEPMDAALDPGWKMFPQGYAQWGGPKPEEKIIPPPWESPQPTPEGETIVAPPWERRADSGPTEQFRADQRRLMRGAFAGGAPVSEQEINDAILQRWKEENPRSDERTKNIGKSPVRTQDGWEMRDNGSLPVGYGSRFEPMKTDTGAGQYGSGGNYGRIWTSAQGDWNGRGDWGNPGTEESSNPQVIRSETPVRSAMAAPASPAPRMSSDEAAAFIMRQPQGQPYSASQPVETEAVLKDRIASLTADLDRMVAQGRGAPRAQAPVARRPMLDEEMNRLQSMPGPVAMAGPAAGGFRRSEGYQSDQGRPVTSDKNAKTGQQKAPAIDMVKKAPGSFYHYRPGLGEDPKERHYGPMAQDLEKSAVGKTVVKTGPDGYKRVDTPRLTLANTAALNELTKRLEALEGGKRGRSAT